MRRAGMWVLALALAAACSAEEDDKAEVGPPGGQGASDWTPNPDGDTGPASATSGGGGFEGCAEATHQVGLAPLNLFITIDRSISMASGDKWDVIKAAFLDFFVLSEADSLNVALRFWGEEDGCDGSSCDAVACSVPQVDLGSLADPAHEQALITLYETKEPGSGTPMSAALAGATLWASERQATHATEKHAVLLVTDGKPAKCEKDIADVAAYAAAAYLDHGVLTFAVGVIDSNEADMDLIAAAGGTTAGYQIDEANAQADLLAALQAIGESAGGCSFTLPTESTNGQPIDPDRVNVSLRTGDGQERTVAKVADASSCGTGSGWYYDNPTGASITLCPADCSAISADADTIIEIVLGCATIVE